jgi:hypothetical protein
MIRDPNYYLEKADFFYEMSGIIGDESYDEDMYIEFEPIDIASIDKKKLMSDIKSKYNRYYDPLTKHYYRTEKIFENDGVDDKNKIIEKDSDIWYFKYKPMFKIVRDINTGKYYRIIKMYNHDGNYCYQYDKLFYRPYKKIGTNFYYPDYKK